MTTDVQKVVDVMLKHGAKRKWYQFEDNGSKVRRVAFVRTLVPSAEATKFCKENQPLLLEESTTLFQHALPRRERPPNYVDDIWLVLDSSTAFQMSIIDKFSFDEGVLKYPERHFSYESHEQVRQGSDAFVKQVVADQKRVLGLVAEHVPYKIKQVGLGLILVQMRAPVAAAELDNFFDEIISFMRKYDRLEGPANLWRKSIAETGYFRL